MNRRSFGRCLLGVQLAVMLVEVRAGSYEDFFAAIERDDVGTVTSLLERGFDPNTRDPQGQVPMYLALRAESLKVAAVLGEHPKLDVDAENALAETPVMMAALRGHLEWCQRLVARGAKLDRTGWTPLHYAASSPNAEVVKWMLRQRVPVDARSPNGTTPLMMAAGYGTEAGADSLLQSGADPTLRNQKDMTAAAFARAVGRESLAARLDKARR